MTIELWQLFVAFMVPTIGSITGIILAMRKYPLEKQTTEASSSKDLAEIIGKEADFVTVLQVRLEKYHKKNIELENKVSDLEAEGRNKDIRISELERCLGEANDRIATLESVIHLRQHPRE